MHNFPNPTPAGPLSVPQAPVKGAAKDIRLNSTDLRIAQYLLNQLPVDSAALRIANSTIAIAVGRSVRTVQDAFERLSRSGLIRRERLNEDDPFSLRQTTLNITAVRKALTAKRDLLSAAPHRRRAKKKTKAAPAAVRFPFAHLREPGRFEAANATLADELSAGHAYWQILSQHASSPVSPLRIKISSQRRKVSDGERGAPMWGRVLRADDLAGIDAYAVERAAVGEEIAFQVVGTNHRLLLIDDVPEHMLAALPALALVLETSPSTYQVTLIAARDLTNDDRRAAQRALVWRFEGDPGALASNQLRRLPGSLNNKAKLSEAFVTRIVRLPSDMNAALSASQTDTLIQDGQQAVGSRKPVKWKAEVAVPEAATNATLGEKAPDNSESVQEFRWAREQLRRGMDKQKLRVQLAQKAHARGKRSTYAEALEYADMTLFNVAKYERHGRTNRSGRRPSAA
ncbi:hypothetical protein CLD22_08110 [Rubrivivax gelatinosus]|nr:hypothetical protein [Rubrivivax gelatinosus]